MHCAENLQQYIINFMKLIRETIKNPTTYKILIDIVVLLLFFVCGFIIFETILPGILSAFISPFKLFATLYILLTIVAFVAYKQNISFTSKKTHTFFFVFFLLIFCACVSLSSIRFNLLFAVLATLLCASVFAMFYSVLQEEFSKSS
ncbi:MAG: hypothetical protein CR972_04955 [Candidatus Moraniibacteriota bacterium]|nr:MAG: hypothetical protein CR972_04955 [Candidatus Moranbacteria bacterium]